MTNSAKHKLQDMIHESYSIEQLHAIERHLIQAKTFEMPVLSTGLYPASQTTSSSQYTGYGNVWVRDTVHIAYARYRCGYVSEAAKATQALMTHFTNERSRFRNIISGRADANLPMNRPHVRFNGKRMEEIPEKWPHAQNDALGYFIWLYCLMASERVYTPQDESLRQLAYIVLYLAKIEYWQDEDSGHWEEVRKVASSSIGAVVAGLQQMASYLKSRKVDTISTEDGVVDTGLVNWLIARGDEALHAILPWDSRQPGKERRYDAALLFLVYPLSVVNEQTATKIVNDVQEHLQGNYGIKRYIGDSFWCADYKSLVSEQERTADFSDDIASRDRLLKPGQEAQWCVFDSIISIIYGRNYQATGEKYDWERQGYYFNRALRQIAERRDAPGVLQCPELYYLDDERYVPNDVMPLLWAQANLSLAFEYMKRSARK